jgi:shikimate kinase
MSTKRHGWGLSHGAVTVVNAIATGRGAAIGIDLATLAEVHLEPIQAETHKVTVQIEGEAADDPSLATHAVLRTLEAHGDDNTYHATVHTRSTIPPGRGLKSSSSAANAVVLATLAALGKRPGDEAETADLTHLEAIRIGVQAALAAGVTITGAFDDAAACYLGGLVATDNPDRAIMHREDVGDLEALLVVPTRRIRTRDTATAPTHPIKPLITEAHALVIAGEWKQAMLRNSLAYGAAYDMPNRLVLSLLDTGAIAAGISGTGPAVAVIIRRDDWDCFTDIIQTLAPDASVLVAHTNHETAKSGISTFDSIIKLQKDIEMD